MNDAQTDPAHRRDKKGYPVMPSMRLLLLSNSTNHGEGYLDHAIDTIGAFLGEAPRRVLFIPYAGVTITWDAYTMKVAEKFASIGQTIEGIHESDNPVEAVRGAEAIAVGGGNTFHLLHHMYVSSIIEPIRRRVRSGVPFMGWSAGSNVACPSIKTTNDMPVIEPPRFDALDLVPFQINPHYTDAQPPGHAGETRADRIAEFVEVDREITVVGLRESSILRVEKGTIDLLGKKDMRVFRYGKDVRDVSPGGDLSFLLE